MKRFVYNKILLFVCAVGLLASLAIAGQRHAVEIKNNQVDMAIDFQSLFDLAQMTGTDFGETLRMFKEAGITSLAIYDTKFERLNTEGKVFAVSGGELIQNYSGGSMTGEVWRQAVEAGVIDANKVYVIGRDLKTYEEVKADLFVRFGKERVRPISIGEMEILEVKDRFETFLKTPIGLPTEEMEIAKNAGFTIIARPTNFEKCTPEEVRHVFDKLKNYPVSAIVFDGNEILGAPNHIDVTADEMRKQQMIFGVIENVSQLQFYRQTGLEELAKEIGYDRIARLYAIPRDEQPKLLIDTAVNRWATTDHERNIRINLFRVYEKHAPGMTLLETNLKYIRDTADKLKANGYTFGKPGTFENYYPARFLRALVVIGVAAAVILYISLISRRINRNRRLQITLFALLAILFAVPVLIGGGGKVRLVAALLSANLFPALAIIRLLDQLRFIRLKARWAGRRKNSEEPGLSIAGIIWLSAGALFVTSAISMAGAAYLSGALSDIKYFLEFEIFRGIKLTFVLPLVLVAVAFLQRFNVTDEERANISAMWQWKKILHRTITVKSLMAALIVIAAFVVLLARSGHTAGMPVSGLEIKLRATLEHLFYARPRTKEILFGHPAFVLAVAAFLKKFPKMICFVLVLAATIGQSSMVETFAHMRTPIFMSFMRGIDGVIPGAIIGAILILFIHFCSKLKDVNFLR